ncbi:hypothetical protein ACFSTE_21210 [Aquimarina hainanensis]|uniref:Gliding motility-associated protein GldM C-terminal domain-containing protein n=1 Tax=Aquimarina hainanensis TaxID=1578017 RepID=A0ABW5NEM8_9FLAO|nr:hypothetical protein [Aquimarina sp. TRL1]QKX07231.1 hypothetical protein HN014_20725 [Aquimarina sp. TRL1]
MKINYIPLFVFLCCFSAVIFSQQKASVLPVIISENMILTKNTMYTFENNITIINNAILTIEEGVTFKNPKKASITFFVEGGSKVVASGSYQNPISVITDKNTDRSTITVTSISGKDMNGSAPFSSYSYNKIENPTILINTNTAPERIASSVSGDF